MTNGHNLFDSVKALVEIDTPLIKINGADKTSDINSIAGKEATANKDASGGYVGLTLFGINFKNALNTFTSLIKNSNTATRNYTFQNRDGTIADDTDLTNTLNSAKAYADGLVVGLWDDRGNHDVSGNTYPSSGGSGTAGAILKGDIWTANVAGVLNSKNVEIGDTIRALVDTPAQTNANWAVAETNVGYVPENSANKNISNGYAGLSALKIVMRNVADSFSSFFTNTNTGSRTYTLQDRDGTIADDIDLAGKVSKTGTETIAGAKSFTSDVTLVDKSINANMDATLKSRVSFSSLNDVSDYVQMEVRSSTESSSLFGIVLAGWAYLRGAGSTLAGLMVGTTNSSPLVVGTNNIERFRVDVDGNQLYAENTNILLPSSLSASGKYMGLGGEVGIAGTTLANGDTAYYDTSTSKWLKTDPTVESKSGLARVRFVLVGGATDATIILTKMGKIKNSSFGTLVVGAPAYLNGTGTISSTKPTGSKVFIRVVGYAISATELDIDISGFYEEFGTWTPVDSSGASLSLTVTNAQYSKIGNKFNGWADITIPSNSDGSVLRIGGFTYAPLVNTGGVSITRIQVTTPTTIEGYVNTTPQLILINNGTTLINSDMPNKRFMFAITFYV